MEEVLDEQAGPTLATALAVNGLPPKLKRPIAFMLGIGKGCDSFDPGTTDAEKAAFREKVLQEFVDLK